MGMKIKKLTNKIELYKQELKDSEEKNSVAIGDLEGEIFMSELELNINLEEREIRTRLKDIKGKKEKVKYLRNIERLNPRHIGAILGISVKTVEKIIGE